MFEKPNIGAKNLEMWVLGWMPDIYIYGDGPQNSTCDRDKNCDLHVWFKSAHKLKDERVFKNYNWHASFLKNQMYIFHQKWQCYNTIDWV